MTDTFASGPSSPMGGSHESPQGSSDVTSTLAELERKLRELEHELSSIGQRRAPSGETPKAAAPTSEAPAATQARADIPTGAWESHSRLIDEAVEREDALLAASPRAAEPAPNGAPNSAQLTGLAELRLFRDRLERFARELTEDYEQVLERVMAEFSATPPVAPSTDDTLFEGRVEVGVGPFYDIGALSVFERQMASLPHASDVAVRRFEASHAVLDLNLNAPVALVRELRAVLDTGFSVRELSDSRLLLAFDEL
jgi:hypothetical protein